MGGSQKAPPRPYTPAQPPPHTVRVYAHLHGGFELACPTCGRVAVIPNSPRTHRFTLGGKRKPVSAGGFGYDPLTGVWACPVCRRSWYVGVILWPVQGKRLRPPDHVPTRAEAEALREHYGRGWATGEGERTATGQGQRVSVNRVCLCGVGCPVHGEMGTEGAETPEGSDDDGSVLGG